MQCVGDYILSFDLGALQIHLFPTPNLYFFSCAQDLSKTHKLSEIGKVSCSEWTFEDITYMWILRGFGNSSSPRLRWKSGKKKNSIVDYKWKWKKCESKGSGHSDDLKILIALCLGDKSHHCLYVQKNVIAGNNYDGKTNFLCNQLSSVDGHNLHVSPSNILTIICWQLRFIVEYFKLH